MKTKNAPERQFRFLANLPPEILGDTPKCTISDNSDIHIENYRSVVRYTEETIVIACRNRMIEIIGESLVISLIADDEICINGNIFSVNFS